MCASTFPPSTGRTSCRALSCSSDAGYYNQVGEPANYGSRIGFICSIGGGPSSTSSTGDPVLYFDYRLDKANADGDPWSLASIGFGLHF